MMPFLLPGQAKGLCVFSHVRRCLSIEGRAMQSIPLERYAPVFSLATDTATPQKPIPIYFIHSLQYPYCRNTTCECHAHQREVARLLGLISDGIITLREAAELEGENG